MLNSLRSRDLRAALALEIFTVSYNALEAIAALVIGFLTRSISLEAFGLDSLIELTAGFVLIWRLNAERTGADAERVERVEPRVALCRHAALVLNARPLDARFLLV